MSKGVEGKAKGMAAIRTYSLREIFYKKHLSTEKYSGLIYNFGTQKHKTMPQMINLGSEMLRITPRGVEYSTSGGRVWSIRYMGTSCGSFVDLLPYGNEILAVTSKGIYYSSNAGRTWSLRYMGTSCGTFQNLMDGGKELLANTDKGLYYSTNGGRSWGKRR